MKKFSLLLALSCLVPTVAHAQDPERVVMKLDEFIKLYEKAKAKREEEPPRTHAISSARYDGEVLFEDGKPYAARFKAKMKIRPLRSKGFARIPVLPATVAIESAKIDGRDAPIVIENGLYTLITDRHSEFELSLVLGAAVTSSQGSSVVGFQLVPSGATSLKLAVPSKEKLDFVVSQAKLKSDKTVGNKRIVEATIPATGQLSISWQRKVQKDEAKKKKSARVYSDVYTLVSVGEGVVRAKATLANTILFAGVERLRYKIPKGMTVLEVEGPGIGNWTAKDGELNVTLNFAAEGSYSLTVEMERTLDASKTLAAPLLIPQDVERAKGWLGVEARGNIELSSETVANAAPIDVRSLPASILGVTSQPVLLGYKYLGSTPSIVLKAAQHEEVDVLVTLLDQTVASTMWTREGRRLTSVSYQVRNNRRQFLKLELPKGAKLWSTSVAGKAVQPAKASDGKVMVPLVRSAQAGNTLSAFAVEVVYVEAGAPVDARGRGTFSGVLPIPDVPSTYVAWTVYSPKGAKVRKRSVDGSLMRVDTLSWPIADARDQAQAQYVNVNPSADQTLGQGMLSSKDTSGATDGGMVSGAAPVLVSLPLEGEPIYFEKLLSISEPLQIRFNYRGLRKR